MKQPISIFNTDDTAGSANTKREGVAVTGTNTYYSEPWSPDTYGAQVQWTGTPTGTLTQWCSDKPNPDRTSDADWVQDTAFAPTNPAGAAGKFRDDVTNSNARWKRYKYVNASGSGTLFGYVTDGDY